MGQLEDIAPTLAILLEGVAEEFCLHQDQLPPNVEAKLIKALLETYRLGGQAVYNRKTFTPQPMPAVRPRMMKQLPPRVPTKDFERVTVHHIKKDDDD